jgi:hypothetical protein
VKFGDRVIEEMTVPSIDAEGLNETGSFVEISNVMFGETVGAGRDE